MGSAERLGIPPAKETILVERQRQRVSEFHWLAYLQPYERNASLGAVDPRSEIEA